MKIITDKCKVDFEGYWNQKKDSDPLIMPRKKLIVHEYGKIFKNNLPKKPVNTLEIGCGTGLWMGYFSTDFGYSVTGIDSSPGAIRLSKRNLDHIHCAYNLIHQDFFSYPTENQYDFVYSFGFIEHFENPVRVIQRMAQFVKKGGYLMIEVPHFSRTNINIIKALSGKKHYTKYLSEHNLRILEKDSFTSLINKSVGNFDIVKLGTVGLFRIDLYPLPGIAQNRIKVFERLVYNLRALIRRLNLDSITPGLMFIGRKTGGN